MTNEERILDSLETISENLTRTREDIASMKTKGEEHSKRLDRMESKVDDLGKKVSEMEKSLAVHKAKSAGIGALGGAGVASLIAGIKVLLTSQ